MSEINQKNEIRVIFDDEARAKIKKGVDIVAKAVVSTIGPKGRNVFIDNDWSPSVVNDGVTIANRISLPDKFENMGAFVVKQAASATNDGAGDGTTTTTCLLQSIVEEGFKASENPMEIKKTLTEAADDAVTLLNEYKKDITNTEQLVQVGTIAAENLADGQIISDVITEVGKDGVVIVEETSQVETNYEIVHGLQIDEGFLAREMATHSDRLVAEYDDQVPVVCIIQKVTVISELRAIFEALEEAGLKRLCLFVKEIDPIVVGILVHNQANFRTLVVQMKEEEIEDIASIVGASIVSEKVGLNFDDFKIENFGDAKKVIATPKKTTIIGTQVPTSKINELESQRDLTKNEYEKEKITKRVGRLTGGLAVIRVGAYTEMEMRHRKLKIDDAVNATKAALKEGIVDGGGVTLYRIAQKLEPKTVGHRILKIALETPIRQIISNAGGNADEILSQITEENGYDANKGEIVNMFEAGIIDPVLVERLSIKNAVSEGGTVITTAAAIILPDVIMTPRQHK